MGSTAAFTVALYHNPYEDNTVIHIDVAEYTDFSITVFDIVGHQVRQINTGSGTSFDVVTKALTSGLYFLVINSDEGKHTIKFTKL